MIILRETPKRIVIVDTPLQTALTIAFGALLVVGLALGGTVLHAIVSRGV